jgi:hypothetical protein
MVKLSGATNWTTIAPSDRFIENGKTTLNQAAAEPDLKIPSFMESL